MSISVDSMLYAKLGEPAGTRAVCSLTHELAADVDRWRRVERHHG